jgi:recombination protein RecT
MSELQKTGTTLKGLLESENVKNKLSEILGKNAATFATSVVQITQQNDMLAKAEPSSIVGAAMTAATLNLPLNNSLGYAYIIPFNERQKSGEYKTKAQFQIGYKGFIQLAMRSGQFKTIHCTDVKNGEIASRDRLTGEMEFSWIDDDSKRKKEKTIGYVAYFKLTNGYEATLYMSMEEVEEHGKKFSQTFKKGFGLWKDMFDSMAEKTVLKLLLSKKAPLSIEMQTAVKTDQAVINDHETEDISYVDNEVIEIDPEIERQKCLVDEAKNLEDVEFAEMHVTDETLLPALKAKRLKFEKMKAKK